MRTSGKLFIMTLALFAASPSFAQGACKIEETNPKRTIVNGYVRYVGEEIGTPGSVIHLSDLAIRLDERKRADPEEVAAVRRVYARRDESGPVPYASYAFEIKAPGFRQKGTVFVNEGDQSSDVRKYSICRQDVSVSIARRDGLEYWVVSTF